MHHPCSQPPPLFEFFLVEPILGSSSQKPNQKQKQPKMTVSAGTKKEKT